MDDIETPCVDCVSDKVEHPRTAVVRDRCQRHYRRARRNGTIEGVYRQRGAQPDICEADCESLAAVKGLCRSHYARQRKGLANWADRLREAPNASCTATWTGEDGEVTCGLPNHAGGLCGSHAWQQRNGKPLGPIRQRKSPGGKCGAGACPRRAVHEGFCGTHYDRRRRGEKNWDRPIKTKAKDGEGWLAEDGYYMLHKNGRSRGMHLWIAEEILGRPLVKGENVHHCNGQRADNRTDGPFVEDDLGRLRSGNLEVWSTKQPAGQRPSDKVAFAREMLALYGTPNERESYATALPQEVAA